MPEYEHRIHGEVKESSCDPAGLCGERPASLWCDRVSGRLLYDRSCVCCLHGDGDDHPGPYSGGSCDLLWL